MSCYLDEQNGTVEAVLSFKRDQLLYDIANYAYIEGHVMETENTHQQHTVQDVGEEGNVDRVTRVLDLNVAKCREMLYPFIKHEIHRHELDDTLKETPAYGMVLKVPQGFSQTTLNLLGRLIHEYLVCKSVADWMEHHQSCQGADVGKQGRGSRKRDTFEPPCKAVASEEAVSSILIIHSYKARAEVHHASRLSLFQ